MRNIYHSHELGVPSEIDGIRQDAITKLGQAEWGARSSSYHAATYIAEAYDRDSKTQELHVMELSQDTEGLMVGIGRFDKDGAGSLSRSAPLIMMEFPETKSSSVIMPRVLTDAEIHFCASVLKNPWASEFIPDTTSPFLTELHIDITESMALAFRDNKESCVSSVLIYDCQEFSLKFGL